MAYGQEPKNKADSGKKPSFSESLKKTFDDKQSKNTGLAGRPIQNWNDRQGLKDVRPGEYGDLLARYQALAEVLEIKDPPPLRINESDKIGQVGGASGTQERVAINKRLIEILTREELDFTLAHELGHVIEQREAAKHNDNGKAKAIGQPDSWIDNESRADAVAVKATHSPEAGISGLTKIAGEQIKEIREEFNGIASPAAFDRAVRSNDELIRKREAGILAVAQKSGIKLKPPSR